MPSRKQRRRRAKERRHEYEYVYVDEEGREVEVEPDGKEPKQPERRTERPATRAGRRIEPPSWRRVGKRALIFAPLMFLTISLIDKEQPIAVRIANTVVLLAFFLPFSYFTDAMLYRSYRRRTGADASDAARRR